MRSTSTTDGSAPSPFVSADPLRLSRFASPRFADSVDAA